MLLWLIKMFIGWLFLFNYQAHSNINCTSNDCSTCSSDYLQCESSCLKICPSGYIQSGEKCKSNANSYFFNLNLASFTNFSMLPISPFSHPNISKFSNTLQGTPIPTIDRGYYFYSNSYLVSNTSWVVGPKFTFQIYMRVIKPGLIFIVKDDSITYFTLSYNGSYIFSFYLADESQNYLVSRSYPYDNNWISVAFVFYQYSNYYKVWINELIYSEKNKEFRMDSDNAKYYMGFEGNLSFSGFIAFISMKNWLASFAKISSVNDCDINQYFDKGCFNCPTSCTNSVSCTRNSCNFCYSENCDSCDGYLLDQCDKYKTNLPIFTKLGKNCIIGYGFNCSVCKGEFSLVEGLCLYPASNFSTIVLRFDLYEQNQGGYFQSGFNETTYSPFNHPEADDPIALPGRGYWFYGGKFMYSNKIILSHSFTILVWAHSIGAFIFFQGKFFLLYESSFMITLSNNEKSLSHAIFGECYTNTWRFFGVIVEFSDSSTHFSIVCSKSITNKQSVSGFAFYDSGDIINITSHVNLSLYLYRMTISQFPNYNFSEIPKICSKPDYDCLNYPNDFKYHDNHTNRILIVICLFEFGLRL